ncbi:MAG TPA: hypothetical protein VF222_09540 [Nitrososphaeraceae archaeon]
MSSLTKLENSSIRNEWVKKGGNLIEAKPYIQKTYRISAGLLLIVMISLPISYHSNTT